MLFFSLLNEKKDIKKVSIVDITEQANYNRAPFYVHYPDKQSLIDEIIDETLDGFS
ncbi:TetR/AcrR family transcriptional regulator [Neobacillus vireti]|uniref:TetR/AcrR family transcriptional regulator n=1 Tax=Neobacillus vireti TaxID=220686 RepID=UPI002FFE96B1